MTANREHYSRMGEALALAPAVYNADVDGVGIPTLDADSISFLIAFGAYTDGNHTFTIEVSNDDVTYAPADADDVLGDLPAVTDGTYANSAVRVAYRGQAPYVRLAVAATGTTGAAYGAVADLGHLHVEPPVRS